MTRRDIAALDGGGMPSAPAASARRAIALVLRRSKDDFRSAARFGPAKSPSPASSPSATPKSRPAPGRSNADPGQRYMGRPHHLRHPLACRRPARRSHKCFLLFTQQVLPEGASLITRRDADRIPATMTREALQATGSSPTRPIFDEEWDCVESIQWIPGLTPREHRKLTATRRAKHEEATVRATVFQREDERDQTAELWHRDHMQTLRDQHRRELWILGAAVILATLVGSVIQAGWITKPW